jgi:Flp pilus assembly protein TadD
MRLRIAAVRVVLAATTIVGTAPHVDAQVGRVAGIVRDEGSQPIKGATILAENDDATPNSFTASSDEKGRFAIIGLRGGMWSFTVQAPGFRQEMGQMRVTTIGAANPPLLFTLRKAVAPPPSTILNGVSPKDIQSELRNADALFNAAQWDQAIAAYKSLLSRVPALNVINLQIAAAYRHKKDYDGALAAYTELLKINPNSDKAKIGVGMTHLEKGDLAAADEVLTTAAQGTTAGREVYFNLGEVKFAKGDTNEAMQWYGRAVDIDPNWGLPVYKLGLCALNMGDKARAMAMMQRVLEVDPLSPEAHTAQTVIDQLKK